MSSGTDVGLLSSRRIRRTPYTTRAEEHGASSFTVVNRTLMPKAYQMSPEDQYRHLRRCVQLWDVGCERQVEISGPDSFRVVQWMTPRDLSRCEIGKCMYVPVIDREAGMVNDPVLLKLGEQRYWLSAADSELSLFALGLAQGAGLNANVKEADVWPLAVQGPKSASVMAKLFGDAVTRLRRFNHAAFDFQGSRQTISRTGYSSQDGFEIYLEGGCLGSALWDAVWEAGQEFGIAPGCPNLADRIEAGLLSCGNEFTRENNPIELGMQKYCSFADNVDFLGRDALFAIKEKGLRQRMRGLLIEGRDCPACAEPWPVFGSDGSGDQIGQVTSAAYSPRLNRLVSLGMLEVPHDGAGTRVRVKASDGGSRSGIVVDLPFE